MNREDMLKVVAVTATVSIMANVIAAYAVGYRVSRVDGRLMLYRVRSVPYVSSVGMREQD